jgi:hypothetical protein
MLEQYEWAIILVHQQQQQEPLSAIDPEPPLDVNIIIDEPVLQPPVNCHVIPPEVEGELEEDVEEVRQ